jgi:transcriptional regulator with XRE-family HTH domain
MEFTRGLSRDSTVTARISGKAREAVVFGERLRALRLARGWTQEQLAEECGLTAVQVSRIENGAHEPKLTTILRLARAFGVKAGKLIEG